MSGPATESRHCGRSLQTVMLPALSQANLHRQIEKCLCSGPELLFLPRCCWCLSYRFSSGCDRELEFQNGLLCGGISYLHRSYGGKADLRFSLSLRIDSGVWLNKIPFPKKIRTFKGDKLLRKAEICDFCSICDPASIVSGGYYGTGCTVLL